MTKDTVYEASIKDHVNKLVVILDENKTVLSDASDLSNTMLATERCLQMLVEALIGVIRYVAKSDFEYKPESSSAALDFLTRKGLLTQKETEQLIKAIGFRNAIVHDYLETDKTIIRSVMANQDYRFVQSIILKLLAHHPIDAESHP